MIPKDKQLHLLAGASIALLIGFFFGAIYGFIAAVIAGAAKEWLYDYYMNKYNEKKGLPDSHDVDPKDFMWTCIGGLCGAVIILAYMYLRSK